MLCWCQRLPAGVQVSLVPANTQASRLILQFPFWVISRLYTLRQT